MNILISNNIEDARYVSEVIGLSMYSWVYGRPLVPCFGREVIHYNGSKNLGIHKPKDVASSWPWCEVLEISNNDPSIFDTIDLKGYVIHEQLDI